MTRVTHKTALLDNLLVVACKNVLQDRHDIANDGKRVVWYISATVSGCCNGRPLSASCEEVQELQTRCQAAFSDNRTWEINGDF